MNTKLQFEQHLQFTTIILLQQSHGFVVLIIPCYHAGTIKEANINNRTGRLRTVTSNISSMHSSMHYQCIHQCIINAFIIAFINASSMHHQCIINVFIASNASISFIQFFLSSSVYLPMHHQCINQWINYGFFNASSMQSINASSMLQ